MKRVLFESSPEFILLCIAVALAYAAIQYYRNKHQPWGKSLNSVLFVMRAVLSFCLAFLLLGPIVKQVNNIFEKPQFVIVHDNSSSVAEQTDSTLLKNIEQELIDMGGILEEKGYEVTRHDLEGEVEGIATYSHPSSDIQGALKKITNRYEGQKIGGVVLVSDGIYNEGLSPLYGTYNFPVYTIGLGDTTQRMDVGIKNIAYNKIAYQGNRFPLRAEVQVKNLEPQDISVSVFRKGRQIEKLTKRSQRDGVLTFDFQPLAEEQGIQKMDIRVEVKPGEQNTRNNRASVLVEVVEGKKRILLVAPTPHPDIKAIREVIERNSNYDFLLHIPGVSEQQPADLRSDRIDLAIFHQSPDIKGKTTSLFQSFVNSRASLFIILGQQSNVQELSRQKMPVGFTNVPRDFDEVTPIANPVFTNFALSTEANSIISEFPPVFVHFGKVQVAPSAIPLLYQRIGNLTTEKPLLVVDISDSRKIGVMLGEGLWRWKLNEYERTENTAAFEELFGKLIQFLSTTEDKRKFRSYPVKQEFSDTEPVIFESQVYNDIFEPVYGNTIDLVLTDETGKRSEYTYVTSPGNARYQIGGLKEGVYRYRSKTTINNASEQVTGEFAVTEQQTELQNLTADFALLRKLSANTGGSFYTGSSIPQLSQKLQQAEAKSIIHTEETYDSVINLKWVFWLLLTLVSGEWFLRKYFGSY